MSSVYLAPLYTFYPLVLFHWLYCVVPFCTLLVRKTPNCFLSSSCFVSNSIYIRSASAKKYEASPPHALLPFLKKDFPASSTKKSGNLAKNAAIYQFQLFKISLDCTLIKKISLYVRKFKWEPLENHI
jgi:hypothetical protein